MNEKRATIITVVCLILIVIGIGASVYYFHMVVLEEKKKELATVETAVKAAKDKQAKIPGLLKQIENLKKEEEQLIKHIPNLDRAEYDTLANMLDGHRRRAGVGVDTARWVTPTKKQPVAGLPAKNVPPTVHKVQYDINVDGSFYQLLRYVNLLEQESRFINVETFSIAKSTETEIGPARGAPKRNMKVTIYSYTYKPLTPEVPMIEAPEQRYGSTSPIPD